MTYTMDYDSPLGRLTLASDGAAITGLWIEGQKYFEDTICGERMPDPGLPVLKSASAWLERYFAGERPSPGELRLHLQGSVFRQRVWNLLCEIPYGQTVTYGELARKLGCRSAQAVGGAVGHNPVSIIVPCHRVLGAGGGLTGYAGGIDRKIWLLNHEGAVFQIS